MVVELGLQELPLIRDRTGAIVDSLDMSHPEPTGGKSMTVPVAIVTDATGKVVRILRGCQDDFAQTVIAIVSGN